VELVETRVAPTLVGRDALQRVPRLAELARVLRFAPFTVAAVVLLDLLGRRAGVPAATLLGGSFRDRVEVHGSVTWDEDPARVVESALEQRETYRWLKLYAGRAAHGRPQRHVGAPSDVIRALDRTRAIRLELLEQPLPLGAEPFQRELVARLAIDVAADESVRGVADASRVVSERTATVINVGMSKLGGPTAALQAAQVAAAGGVGVMVGGVIEMGIAAAMGLHLAAALPHLAYPSYLMSPLKYREQITAEQITVVDAHVAVPTGPGLGIEVDESALRHLDARARR
jgi:L-alanine-DL-glutamate epimerase-like enolase superfamily enzyme